MGFLDWLTGKKESQQIVRLDGPGDFEIEVVGESHYQDALAQIAGGKTEEGHKLEKDALLIHHDENPCDNKAVAVSIGGEIVGHLNRKMARQFRVLMKEAGVAGHPAVCRARIVGGWEREDGDEGQFGVRLDLPHE